MDDDVEMSEEQTVEAATKMGWIPEERYKGPLGEWKSAAEYLSRGREILPIVRANNRKLLNELNDAKAQLAELKGVLTTQQQTTKDLLQHQVDAIKQGVESRLADLRAEKKAAIKDGDHDLAADLEEQIDKTRDQLAEANKPKAVASPPPAPQGVKVEPWAQEFADDNSEWLSVDKRRTALFQGIAQDLFETTELRAGALLSEAKKQMEAMLDKAPPQRMGKSEGGSGGWEGSGSAGGRAGSSSFKDLPSEAKDACRSQEKKYVGPKGSGKAFESAADWQKHYAETFFASQKR